MTIKESVIFRVGLLFLTVTMFAACTTGGVNSEGRRPTQFGGVHRP